MVQLKDIRVSKLMMNCHFILYPLYHSIDAVNFFLLHLINLIINATNVVVVLFWWRIWLKSRTGDWPHKHAQRHLSPVTSTWHTPKIKLRIQGIPIKVLHRFLMGIWGQIVTLAKPRGDLCLVEEMPQKAPFFKCQGQPIRYLYLLYMIIWLVSQKTRQARVGT